jgi:hypothetical protein
MTNEQQRSPVFCLDKLKKHLYNTIWGIKPLLMTPRKSWWVGTEKKWVDELEDDPMMNPQVILIKINIRME